MKKIIKSSAIIVAVAAIVIGGTVAYFSDTEKSSGNTFTTGTIDIAVDEQNPWTDTRALDVVDMKPSQHEYTEYVIKNVGSNPANVWKKTHIVSQVDNDQSEPECDWSGGDWNGSSCNYPNGSKDNIASAIRYDMAVWVYETDPKYGVDAKWWQVIYTDEMNKRLGTINNVDILLGMVPAGWYMKVQQSYHMDADTGNWAQGDKLTFDITLTAEQLKGTVYMENKDFAAGEEPTIVHDDGIDGEMTYTVKDATFDWEFKGTAPLASTEYALIFYYEEWSTPSATGWPRDVYVLGKKMTDGGGYVEMSDSEDLTHDVLNMKVWLVKVSDLTSGALGDDTMFGWTNNGEDTLYELGMMDYYDSL